MYRLIRTNDNIVEVLRVSEDENFIINEFKNRVLEHASNADEYRKEDIENMIYNLSERVGNYVYTVDEVSVLTDDQIVKLGGGICAYCHSDETDGDSCEMEDGYVSRTITCNICGKDTVEQYSLSGKE